MKIRYFADTDTLHIELNDNLVVETREINENTMIDLDADGNLVALTLEHARGVTDLSEVSLHQVVTQSA
ncbi:hypothetical protein LCGC14_3078380 [marine sediment metagenome]|uniref:DUF2283 domain-containing protein n=1 Tax=marine sediment metagenome TaxID=412755 RepID=A0A0F8Z4R7_9ZZZZ